MFGQLVPRSFNAAGPGYLAYSAGYMPDQPDADEFYDPSSHGPDLSRGFPGFRVWLCVKLLGAQRLLAAIREKRELAMDAAARIAKVPGIIVDAPPQLSLFAFHASRPGRGIEEENRATRRLLDIVNARQHVMLTGCTVDGGRFLARGRGERDLKTAGSRVLGSSSATCPNRWNDTASAGYT